MTIENRTNRVMAVLAGVAVALALTMAAIIGVQAVSCNALAESATAEPPTSEVRDTIRAREAGPLKALGLATPEVEDPVDPELVVFTAALARLQPYLYSPETPEAMRLAAVILKAAKARKVPPMVALAVARRESSLHPKIGLGFIHGPGGERGFFQIFKRGVAERTCGGGCDQLNPECNARTAMCWMDFSRTLCGDDPWMYVGAYGRTRCPHDAAEARTWSEVRRARRFFCEAMGASCETVWPQ